MSADIIILIPQLINMIFHKPKNINGDRKVDTEINIFGIKIYI